MIPNEYKINDTRGTQDFSKQSFSGFAIKDVVSILNKSLMECKIEESVNWAVELLLSGQTERLWEKIFSISLKNININNPKLPMFLFKRYSKFVSLKLKYSGSAKSSNIAGYLSLRNSQAVRNMMCEVCVIICNSTKLKAISMPKIKEGDFDISYFKTRLVATDANVIGNKMKYGDPPEIKIPLNEFNFCIKTRKWELAIYWLAWVFEWERRNTKRDKHYICGVRKIDGVEEKYYTDIVWIIWEILIKEAPNLKNDNASSQIYALFKLYKFDFKPTKKAKRIFFFLYAIKFFTEMYNFKNDIIPNHYQLVQACGNINIIFFDKKKHEVNKHKQSLEKNSFNKIKSKAITEKEQKEEKAKLKRLKEVAEIKIKQKINRVEMIDSLILSNNKKK
jgi:hypothetical protein